MTVSDCSAADQRDLTRRKPTRFVLWQLPVFLFVVGAFGGNVWHTMLWTTALTVAGTACIVNAARCGRLHCYFTGPFFLLGAIVTLSYGLGVLPLGGNRWGSIGSVVALGTCFLFFVPEWRWGKYVTRARPAGG
jgi:hypothetical protein